MTDSFTGHTLSHRMDNEYAHRLCATVVLMSVSPEGMQWLDEHAPEWRQHVSCRTFESTHIVDEARVERLSPEDLLAYTKEVVGRLGENIGKAIARACEPAITVKSKEQ